MNEERIKKKESGGGGEVWCGTREVMREKTSTSRQGEGGGGKRQLVVKELFAYCRRELGFKAKVVQFQNLQVKVTHLNSNLKS
ncbi:unnamed protein product [Lactuca virosa]|uniref:Uncharacterized protein n=1 Tax=Lactuca virosa TaxID=75947 RepID=A0AAU9LYJ7_9ASTR|nr:unnamed protein product [Lactuca virosa]